MKLIIIIITCAEGFVARNGNKSNGWDVTRRNSIISETVLPICVYLAIGRVFIAGL